MGALLEVNGTPVALADAIRRAILHDDEFLETTITVALVREHAAKKGLSNSDAELQLAADELRYQRGLESVEKLRHWIKANNQTELSLQSGVDDMLLRNKLRSAITDVEIETFFAEHRLEFDRVVLYSCRVGSEEKARELLAQINDDGADFHVLTMAHSEDAETRLKGGFVGLLARSDMTSELEPVVFKAVPGAVVGPVKTEKGWNLFKVAGFSKALLEHSREEIRAQIFTRLLAGLRAQAVVSYPVLETA